jgi:hypothetical protein
MTKPRQSLLEQIVLLTRRIEERRYFLCPCMHVNKVVMYEIAKAAEASGLTLHGLMTMSNHPHIVATDHLGERSDFMRDFCAGVARARNRRLDRKGHFWDTQQFGDTVLLDRQAIEEKLLYTWLNPVHANLVERAEDWPGPKILPKDWGKPQTITAPNDGFYNQKKAKVITFTPQPPPGYEDMTLEEVVEHFETLLREAEDLLIARRRRLGRRVLGRRRILKLDPFDAPGTRARSGKLNPRFATHDPALMEQAVKELRQFHADYAEANDRWRKGDRDVWFPPGTIRHRKVNNANCHDPLGCEVTVYRPAA